MIYDRESMLRYGEAVAQAAKDAHNKVYGKLYRADADELDDAADEFEERLEEALKQLAKTV